MSSNPYNVLFFSNNCEASKHLIALMNGEDLMKFFYTVLTDSNPKVPPGIKVTPTIIIAGVPTPYVAGDAFIWFAKIKQWKLNTLMQNVNASQQQCLGLSDSKSNILGFNPMEMSAMSDMFSFFSKNASNECSDALPQSYVSYANITNDNIITPPLEGGTYRAKDANKINEEKQKALCQKLQMERLDERREFKKNRNNFINLQNK